MWINAGRNSIYARYTIDAYFLLQTVYITAAY